MGRNPTLPFGVFRRFPLIVVYCSDSEIQNVGHAKVIDDGYKQPVAQLPELHFPDATLH